MENENDAIPWALAWGEEGSSPPGNRKNVVENWCYFPELYKMTEVQEDGIENG